jgi:2-polyprenyl-3-methyl-5-hydroxy-6-metoxy-1,4-benzoquinol methylase
MNAVADPVAAPLGAALRGAVFHYVRVLANGPALVREVGSALAAAPGERVLDLGCGCGGFSTVVPGEYVGIDLNPNYIAFARRRFGTDRRRFELKELAALDGRETFDKAIMASVLHHLSDADASSVLALLARIVRRRLIVLDLDPDSANRFQAFLIANDRGHFVRPAARQRAVLEEHFRVVGERRFANSVRTAVHTLFTCEPRA